MAGRPWNASLNVFVVLSLCVIAANWSALEGQYVYDDQILPAHPMLDGFDDALSALFRNSQDYLATATSGGGAKGVTYRPLPMASFALTQALTGSLPWVHHCVSLSFHLLALWFLTRCAQALCASEGLSMRAIAALMVFALHPVGVEAYGWINGRSDAMAGAMLCGAASVLSVGQARSIWLLVLLTLGCLCKETFIVASFALLAAWQVVQDSKDRGTQARVWLAWSAALCAFFLMRSFTGGGGSSGVGLASLRSAVVSSARLVALANEALFFPWPKPMLLLASALSRPMGSLEFAGTALASAFLAKAGYERDLRRLLLYAGAGLTLLPTGLISNGFWLGFDRYLYMPVCLLIVSALPSANDRQPSKSLPWLAAPVALYLGWASYVEGSFLRSQEAFARSMAEARPYDPTGDLFLIQLAAARGDEPTVRALTRSLPVHELPAPLLQRAIALKLSWGTRAEADALIAEARRRFPDDRRFVQYAQPP